MFLVLKKLFYLSGPGPTLQSLKLKNIRRGNDRKLYYGSQGNKVFLNYSESHQLQGSPSPHQHFAKQKYSLVNFSFLLFVFCKNSITQTLIQSEIFLKVKKVSVFVTKLSCYWMVNLLRIRDGIKRRKILFFFKMRYHSHYPTRMSIDSYQ